MHHWINSDRQNYFCCAGQTVQQTFIALPDILDSLPDILLPDVQQMGSFLPDISSTLTTARQNAQQCLNSLPGISKSCWTCMAYVAITVGSRLNIDQHRSTLDELRLTLINPKCLMITIPYCCTLVLPRSSSVLHNCY